MIAFWGKEVQRLLADDPDGLALALAGASIGGGALAAHRETAAMTDATVAVDGGEALEMGLELTPSIITPPLVMALAMRAIWSSLSSPVRASGSTPASSRILVAVLGPIPKM
jgi:hypothetical protein